MTTCDWIVATFPWPNMSGLDDTVAYWLSRPVDERLQGIERLRIAFYGESEPAAGFSELWKWSGSKRFELSFGRGERRTIRGG